MRTCRIFSPLAGSSPSSPGDHELHLGDGLEGGPHRVEEVADPPFRVVIVVVDEQAGEAPEVRPQDGNDLLQIDRRLRLEILRELFPAHAGEELPELRDDVAQRGPFHDPVEENIPLVPPVVQLARKERGLPDSGNSRDYEYPGVRRSGPFVHGRELPVPSEEVPKARQGVRQVNELLAAPSVERGHVEDALGDVTGDVEQGRILGKERGELGHPESTFRPVVAEKD